MITNKILKESSFLIIGKNNMLDWLVLYDDSAEIFRCHVQSVANYNFGDFASADTVEYGDTLHEGYFKLKLLLNQGISMEKFMELSKQKILMDNG